jgi:hypothetical protein
MTGRPALINVKPEPGCSECRGQGYVTTGVMHGGWHEYVHCPCVVDQLTDAQWDEINSGDALISVEMTETDPDYQPPSDTGEAA